MGITESHLCDEILDENVNIDNYRFLRQDRQNKSGGSCLIFYKESLNVIPKPELTVGTIESIWFELIINSQWLLIRNVYRAPDNYEFYNHFKTNLERIWLKRNNILIMGDFNVDFSKTSMNNAENYRGRKLQGITKSFGLVMKIVRNYELVNNENFKLALQNAPWWIGNFIR